MDELNNNEQNDVIQNAPKRYLLGILGALLGGFIASIPWILMYVYGNMIFSALAILIAIGALKGYQILKGTIDKKLPVIISVVSLLSVIVATLVIIPILLIMKEGYNPSIYNFQLLYANSEFSSAIMKDLIISIVFTILGISGVVANLNKQIKNSTEPLDEIKISSTLSNSDTVQDNHQAISTVKDIFVKYNAMSKENAIDKTTILTDLQELENGKQLFNTLKMQQIIRKSKGKYYFSEKAEKSTGYRFGILFGKWMLVIAIIFIIIIALTLLDDTPSDNTSGNTFSNDTVQNTTKTTTYPLTDFGIKIEVPINMTFTSDSYDLDYLLGEDAHDFYEFAIYNENDLISCFIKTTNANEVESYYESLKQSFVDDTNYTIISDYKTETISGFEFTTLEAQIEFNGTLFNDLCLGYLTGDKFIFFEYSYPTNSSNPARTVLEYMIKNVK